MPPEKQKILYKGKVLKDDAQIKALEMPEGAAVMLMGAAEGEGMQLEVMQEKKVFIEDMTDEQKAKFHKETFGVVSLLQDRSEVRYSQPRKHLLHQLDSSSLGSHP